jgi:hypothetical protein
MTETVEKQFAVDGVLFTCTVNRQSRSEQTDYVDVSVTAALIKDKSDYVQIGEETLIEE